MIKIFRKKSKGFTLIELLVVISIIGILAAIAIPRFLAANETARGAKIMADLRTIDSAAMMLQAATGTLASSSAELAPYLAVFPVPPVGTFTTPRSTTAATAVSPYTVVGGRGLHDGHPVEYYTTAP